MAQTSRTVKIDEVSYTKYSNRAFFPYANAHTHTRTHSCCLYP